MGWAAGASISPAWAVGAGVAQHAGSLDPGDGRAGSMRWFGCARMPNQTPARLLELAGARRREQPARTAAQTEDHLESRRLAVGAARLNLSLAAGLLPWKGGQMAAALGWFEAESGRAVDGGRAARPDRPRSAAALCLSSTIRAPSCGIGGGEEGRADVSRALAGGESPWRGALKASTSNGLQTVGVRSRCERVLVLERATPRLARRAEGMGQDRAGVP